MKRLLVVALVIAGCASKTPPQERPLPPGMVTVATFTAEADPVARTFTIRTQPTAAGLAQGMTALLDTDVLVENEGLPWFDSTADFGCPAGMHTWGANVKVSSLLGDTIWLSGVYAEITAFAGPAGSEACNGDPVPEGLNPDYGVWSYPTIGHLDPGPQTVAWAFTRVNGENINFSGRIVAAKVSMVAVLDGAAEGDQVVGNNGTNMVYASSEFDGLQFVNFDGSDDGTSILVNGQVSSVAAVPSRNLVWITTRSGEVGFLSSDGLAGAFATGGTGDLGAIVPDPNDVGRAWFRSNGGTFIRSVDVGPTPVVRPVPISTAPHEPWGMAIGPDDNLYVTSPSDNTILVYSTGASGGVLLEEFTTEPGCAGPTSIIQGPGGTMWFSAEEDHAVCSFTSSADVAPVNDPLYPIALPSQLTVGPDGFVWVADNSSSQLVRVDATGPGYRITLPNEAGAFGVATGGGKLWGVDVYGIYPIVLDP